MSPRDKGIFLTSIIFAIFVINQSVCDFRTQVVEKARADAEKVKLMGLAEATAIENIGRAEAEAMRMKAAAYKQYGEAATLSLVFEALPKVILYTFILNSFFFLKII